MILQYAHYLRDKWQEAGITRPIVTAHTWVSLNGRPHQRLIDPTVNLAEVPLNPFAPADWVLPLAESPAHDPKPTLYLLTLTAMVLVNTCLMLTCYLVVAYCCNLKNTLGNLNSFSDGLAKQEITSSARMPAAALIKVVSSLLPYLFTLLSLAAWAITDNPNWLILSFFSIVVAASWKFHLASTLTSRSIHLRTLGLMSAPLNLLTGLFLLLIAIIAPG